MVLCAGLSLLGSGAAFAGSGQGSKPQGGVFFAVYSGKAHYSSHRSFSSLDQSETDDGKWTVGYRLKVPDDGPAKLVGDEGVVFPDSVEGGYHTFGSGGGQPFDCRADLDARHFPESGKEPLLAGKPRTKEVGKGKHRHKVPVLEFRIDAPAQWQATGFQGTGSCSHDESQGGFFPALPDHRDMLQANFDVPVSHLRALGKKSKLIVPVSSDPDLLPPENCSTALTTCTQKLDPWSGKVVFGRA
jgi:hypothetical protein